MLEFRLPRLDEQSEFDAVCQAIPADSKTFLHYYQPGMPLAEYLSVIGDQRLGNNPPSSKHVPSTFLFAFVGSRIVGRVSVRHRLNSQQMNVGGHIGYAVLPEFRRRGYGTEILRWATRYAMNELGIDQVLVTCDVDNDASIRVIEKNGGVLENLYDDASLAKPKRRYWITKA